MSKTPKKLLNEKVLPQYLNENSGARLSRSEIQQRIFQIQENRGVREYFFDTNHQETYSKELDESLSRLVLSGILKPISSTSPKYLINP